MSKLYEVYYLLPTYNRHKSTMVEVGSLEQAKEWVRREEGEPNVRFLEVWVRVLQEEEE